MSYGILFALLILVMVARLRLTFRDQGARAGDLIVIGALPLLSLVFLEVSPAWFALLVLFPLTAFLMRWTEGLAGRRNYWRLVTLILYVVVLAVLCSPLGGLSVNSLPVAVVELVEHALIPGVTMNDANVLRVELYIFGIVAVLNEMNILLRYLLQLLQLEPREEASGAPPGKGDVDEQEYNTGRVIGMLERIFVYVFVLAGQYAAIGFILAAKGVARFREFENRTFAEYVLIGTLLSTLLAFFVGYFVRWTAGA